MLNIKALADKILFTFLNDTNAKFFEDKTASGIVILANTNDSIEFARWGKAVAVGKDVVGVTPGDYILIDKLQWTLGCPIDGKKIWRTEEKNVLGLSDERPDVTY
jgi:co-chaperonin GroES (HSP10)